MFFKSRRSQYTNVQGPIRYLGSKGLARPLDMPKPQLVVMGVFVAIAIGIGIYLVVTALDSIQGGAARSQASVEENLARPVTYDLPALSSLIFLSDDEIRQVFTDAGYATIDTSNAEDYPSGGFELIKLPSDVSAIDAGLLYQKGIAKLSASDASLLLNGSWTFSIDRKETTDTRLRYADFTSGSLDAAIQSAIATEGFDPATTPEDGLGVDEAGNTYQSGTMDIEGTLYTWRVSAIELSNVYDISGLPSTATYVGIRLTL